MSFMKEERVSVPIQDYQKNIFYPTGEILSGGLNTNRILKSQSGERFILRESQDNPITLAAIEREFQAAGFLDYGGTFYLRNSTEQAEFMIMAAQQLLPVVQPTQTTSGTMILPFIEGIALDTYLKQGHTNAVHTALQNLYNAHKKGIVYGDRWIKNSIVTPENNVIEIDFDIALEGPCAAEYEIAQTLYHMLHFSTNRPDLLNELYTHFQNVSLIQCYNPHIIKQFLINYGQFFQEEPYENISGGIQKEIQLLLYILQQST